MCKVEKAGERSEVSYSIKERNAVGFSSDGKFLNLERGTSEQDFLSNAR